MMTSCLLESLILTLIKVARTVKIKPGAVGMVQKTLLATMGSYGVKVYCFCWGGGGGVSTQILPFIAEWAYFANLQRGGTQISQNVNYQIQKKIQIRI